jgi:hypothetical protein
MGPKNQCVESAMEHTRRDHPVNSSDIANGKPEVTGASASARPASDSMFQQLFERSADAIFLFDPGREVLWIATALPLK